MDISNTLNLTPAAPALGANVHGVDLRRPIEPELARQLRTAMAEHYLLCFRARSLAAEDRGRIAALFGPVGDENLAGFGRPARGGEGLRKVL